MTAAGVHVAGASATPYRKFFSTWVPCSVCSTSGWNWTPYRPRSGSSNAAIGVDGEPAVTRAPVGAAVTESRCDIQTVSSSGSPAKSAPPSARNSVRPNSEAPVRSTEPPRSSAMSCMP